MPSRVTSWGLSRCWKNLSETQDLIKKTASPRLWQTTCWLFFVNMTQSRHPWEERNSVKELPSLDWPSRHVWGAFSWLLTDWLLTDWYSRAQPTVGSTIPEPVAQGCLKKWAEQASTQNSSCLASCAEELQPESQTPFPSQAALDLCSSWRQKSTLGPHPFPTGTNSRQFRLPLHHYATKAAIDSMFTHEGGCIPG